MLVEYASHHIQHMQKALTQLNIEIQHVLSNITGMTGTKIIVAIAAGERDPHRLARFRHRSMKATENEIAESLRGHWREEHIFELAQALELYKTYQRKIDECDSEIEVQLGSFEDRSDVGDGVRYASRWGSFSPVVTEPGLSCNALPSFGVASYSFSVFEDARAGTLVGTTTATDFDATDRPVHSITAGNDDGKFAIDASTGEITVAGTLDRSATSSYSLTVMTSDSRTVRGVPGERAVSVSITVAEPLAVVDAAACCVLPSISFCLSRTTC